MRTEYELSVISPLHIGDGHKLDPYELDVHDGTVRIMNLDKLMAQPGVSPDELVAYIQGGRNLFEYSRSKGFLDRDVEAYSLSTSAEMIPSLLTTIKTKGLPYIPGSSIKGAIRTCLFWWLLKNNSELRDRVKGYLSHILTRRKKPRRERVDGEIIKLAFGRDPHHDILRTLQISDSDTAAISEVRAEHVQVLTLPKFRRKYDLYLEIFKSATVLQCSIKWDDYLLTGHVARELGFSGKAGLARDFPSMCNEFATTVAEHELKILGGVKDEGAEKMRAFYTRLLDGLKKADEKFFLNLGWGGGWITKTPGILFKEQLSDLIEDIIREYYKRPGFPFPKSRRVVVDGGYTPLGWVKIQLGG